MILLCAGITVLIALLRVSRTAVLALPLATVYSLAMAFTAAAAATLQICLAATGLPPPSNLMAAVIKLTLCSVSSLLVAVCGSFAMRAAPRLRRQLQSERLFILTSSAAAAVLCLASISPSENLATQFISLLTSASLGLLFALCAVVLAWLRERARLSSAAAALPLRSTTDFDLSRTLLFLALLTFCLLALAGVL